MTCRRDTDSRERAVNIPRDAVKAMRSGDQPRTVAEAAAELNLSRATIRSWIAQRRLGYVRLGRAIRIPALDIQRVLRGGYVPSQGGPRASRARRRAL